MQLCDTTRGLEGEAGLTSIHAISFHLLHRTHSVFSIYLLLNVLPGNLGKAKRRHSAKEGMIQTIVSHNIHSRVERGAKKTNTFEGEGKRGQLLCFCIVKRDEHKLKRSKINVELK